MQDFRALPGLDQPPASVLRKSVKVAPLAKGHNASVVALYDAATLIMRCDKLIAGREVHRPVSLHCERRLPLGEGACAQKLCEDQSGRRFRVRPGGRLTTIK